uniref:Uncharacterized protein n=1 Tax=Arundo donax TaxID=35708 RepID=A0A0A8YI19_ARUDO
MPPPVRWTASSPASLPPWPWTPPAVGWAAYSPPSPPLRPRKRG